MKVYELIPKNGKGCTWYCWEKDIFKKPVVPAFSLDGFETPVLIDYYTIADSGYTEKQIMERRK